MWKIRSNTTSIVHRYLGILLIICLLASPFVPTYSYATTTVETTDPVQTTETQSGDTPSEQYPVVLIETGTTEADTETYNFSNTNDIDTTAASETEASTTPNKVTEPLDEPGAAATETSSSTDNSLPIEESATLDSPASSTATSTSLAPTVIEIENQATSTTAATTSATTGNNNGTSSGSGAAIVDSGAAYAYTNVVNLTNTNIINSDGFIVFLNQLFGTSNIDFRDMFDVFSPSTTTTTVCTDDDCQAGSLEAYISNQTTVSNNITVVADTGNNQTTGGTAAVLTGDAYAAANVTNMANTNLIDANYLVMTFSNFGDLFGDMIFPGADLLAKLFQSSPSIQTEATITNNTTIENQVTATANTGDNYTTGSTSVIETGDATTYTNIYNQTNTNAINSDSFTILFRVHGDWAGEVFGLPEGLTYEHTAAGITISNTTSQSTPALANSISAEITNGADIKNSVSVKATTGNNHAYGDELGYVGTGDAYAAANVTNVANTNILGRNWSLLIFDIFGNWNGDISFGQPDIWIGGSANALNGTTAAGDNILYTFTISNLGDATAHNVALNGHFNSDLITLAQPIDDIVIGSIAPGETIEKTFAANVSSSLPAGSFPIDLTAELTSDTPDADLDNNSEVVTVIAENHVYRGGGGSRSKADRSVITKIADVDITKTADLSTIEPGDTVTYSVTLTNLGGPVYDAILYDTLYDSTGAIMLDQNWPLYTIDTNETVTIHYDVAFASSTTQGTYFNRAQLLGYHKNVNPKYRRPYDSMVATVPLQIGKPLPTVLGIATSTECNQYLTSYLQYNQVNNTDDVRRLQTFLSERGILATPVTGNFNISTQNAVKTFQREHKETILSPWGLSEPTGHVYYTTQKTINELKCDGEKTFPLTVGQVTEIARFKTFNHPTLPLTPPPQTAEVTPILVKQTTLPEPEIEPIAAAPQLIRPDLTPLAEPLHHPSPAPAEETTSTMRKIFHSIIQTGSRVFSQIKFW